MSKWGVETGAECVWCKNDACPGKKYRCDNSAYAQQYGWDFEDCLIEGITIKHINDPYTFISEIKTSEQTVNVKFSFA